MNSSHSSSSEHKTEVLYGAENILKSTLEITSEVKHSIDNCIDSSAPLSFVSKDLPMFKALSEARKKGIKSRFITEITRNNIVHCKELMKIVELRHLDKIKGNFGIIDGKDYRASASIIEGHPPNELIVSTVKTFVEQQQSICHARSKLRVIKCPLKMFSGLPNNIVKECITTADTPVQLSRDKARLLFKEFCCKACDLMEEYILCWGSEYIGLQ